MSFTLEQFVTDIRTAAASAEAVRQVNRIMTDAVRDPAAVADAVPAYAGDEHLLHEDDSVSIYCVRFYADQIVPPHEHKMPAFIGVYAGTEINELYRYGDEDGLNLVKERAVGPGQTLSIGAEGIHGVRTADPAEDSFALHVYLGRLAARARYLYPKDGSPRRPYTPENFAALVEKR